MNKCLHLNSKRSIIFLLSLLIIFILGCDSDPENLGTLKAGNESYPLTSGRIKKGGIQNSGFVGYDVILTSNKNTYVELFLVSSPGDWIAFGTYKEGGTLAEFELNTTSTIAVGYKVNSDGSTQGKLYKCFPQSGTVKISKSGELYVIEGLMDAYDIYSTYTKTPILFSFSGKMKEER